MPIRSAPVMIIWIGLGLAACAGPAKKPLVDPFPLRFPLVEAGTLEIEGHIAGRPTVRDGIVYFATREGFITAVVASSRSVLWRSQAGQPVPDSPEVPGGPVFVRDGGLLRAVDGQGKPVWEFRAEGAIRADPAVAGGRVYFGAADRMFYCLDAETGKQKWRRRLQGAPLHPPVVKGKTIAVAASNSVVYFLSRKGGSILSWEALPSRVVYEPAAAGPTLLVSSASKSLLAFDLETGKSVGRHVLEDPAVAGPLWVPPYVILVEEAAASGRQRLAFLRSR